MADAYEPSDLCGTLACLHVLNVPGYSAQTRDIPIHDQDLNRAFPGGESSTTAERTAAGIYRRFVAQCDLGIDFHTSTRNRTTVYHVRRHDRPRGGATRVGVRRERRPVGRGRRGVDPADRHRRRRPTIAVEMGKAHRFQPALIDRAVAGVESVPAECDVLPDATPSPPAWTRVIRGAAQRRWIRADTGGLAEMRWGASRWWTRAIPSAP